MLDARSPKKGKSAGKKHRIYQKSEDRNVLLSSLGVRSFTEDFVDLAHGAVNLILKVFQIVLAAFNGRDFRHFRHLFPILLFLISFYGVRVRSRRFGATIVLLYL